MGTTNAFGTKPLDPVRESTSQTDPCPLLLQGAGSFYVGGENRRSEALVSANFPLHHDILSPSGTYTAHPMYVQYKIPAVATRVPIVLIHGGGLTGTTWETTPDGRMGWEEYFVRQGHPVYTVDQVGRGRSGFDPTPINQVGAGRAPVNTLPPIATWSHEGAWQIFRFGPQYPHPFPGIKFPLHAIGEFWKQSVPDFNAALPTPNPTLANLSALAHRLRGAVLIGHAEAGTFPWQTALLNPDGIRGIIVVEGGAGPGLDRGVPVFAKIPTLVLFGDYISQSPFWTAMVQSCQRLTDQIKAAGGTVRLIQLPELGIYGNTHMLMQDTNNLQVAQVLDQWIRATVEEPGRAVLATESAADPGR